MTNLTELAYGVKLSLVQIIRMKSRVDVLRGQHGGHMWHNAEGDG